MICTYMIEAQVRFAFIIINKKIINQISDLSTLYAVNVTPVHRLGFWINETLGVWSCHFDYLLLMSPNKGETAVQ